VERLDYTKGIPLKLQAFRRLLTEHKELLGKVVLIQIVVPSREAIASYGEQRQEIEQIVGQINGEFGSPGMVPITTSIGRRRLWIWQPCTGLQMWLS
jgi:trehalose 6-phosphate synthase